MELANYAFETILFLFFIALIAGFLDTLVGGGGLLSIPALMISGVPPIATLGTNKLQASFGIGTATIFLFKKKKFSFAEIKFLLIYSFIGSAVGAFFIQFVDTDILSFIIPIVLSIIIVYFVIYPEVKQQNKPSNRVYQKIILPAIGCYDGMLGPATGSFFVLANVFFQQLDLIKATILAKPLNLASNLSSLIIFILFGQVFWFIGFVMIIGQAIGAILGAKCLIKTKVIFLRILIVLLSLSMLIKYIYSNNIL